MLMLGNMYSTWKLYEVVSLYSVGYYATFGKLGMNFCYVLFYYDPIMSNNSEYYPHMGKNNGYGSTATDKNSRYDPFTGKNSGCGPITGNNSGIQPLPQVIIMILER